MVEALKSAEVRRILDRYLIEVVENYDLCPWARTSRLGGDLAIEILYGAPTLEDWVAAAQRALAAPETKVAMVVAPELEITARGLHSIRNDVTSRVGVAGIADFHPDAELELASPPRLVPFLRRSPDPMLQLVPLALLDSVRAAHSASRRRQAEILGGMATSQADVADKIAAANHVTVSEHQTAIIATFAAIAADRRTSYARVGLSASR